MEEWLDSAFRRWMESALMKKKGGSHRNSRLWVEGLAVKLFIETAVLTVIWH